MQNLAWVVLLRQIPAEQHNQYTVTTRSGTEIAIQTLLLIEQEFVAFKGRLAGSQDAGRVFFIPYDNIDYIGTQQPIKESEFNEVFESLVMPGPRTEPVGAAEDNGVAARAPETAVRPVIRSEILERYRSRPSSSPVLPTPPTRG